MFTKAIISAASITSLASWFSCFAITLVSLKRGVHLDFRQCSLSCPVCPFFTLRRCSRKRTFKCRNGCPKYLWPHGRGITYLFLAAKNQKVAALLEGSVVLHVFRYVDDFLYLFGANGDVDTKMSKTLQVFSACLKQLVITHETPECNSLRFLDIQSINLPAGQPINKYLKPNSYTSSSATNCGLHNT